MKSHQLDAAHSNARFALSQFIHRNPSLNRFTDTLSDSELTRVVDNLVKNLEQGIPVLPPSALAEELSDSPERRSEWKVLLRSLKLGDGLSGTELSFLAVGLLWLTLLDQAIRGREIYAVAKPWPRVAKPFF